MQSFNKSFHFVIVLSVIGYKIKRQHIQLWLNIMLEIDKFNWFDVYFFPK